MQGSAPPRSPYCQISFSLGEDTARAAELKEAGLAAILKGMLAAGGPAEGGGERAVGGGRQKGRQGFHLLLGLALAGTTWQTAAAPHTTGILLATFLPKFLSQVPDGVSGRPRVRAFVPSGSSIATMTAAEC